MAYVITRLCERVGACVEVCPTDSIHFVEDDPEWPTYYINPDTCIECGACEAECPNEAIFHEDEVPEEYQDDIQKNADFFQTGPGKDLV
ncbi:MAG TPA: ferredoxin family protein [Chloroflexi bacterium]|nr:ferredoxin family protein [Chloroflexota bacterium]